MLTKKFTVVSIVVDPNPVKPALASEEEAKPLIYYWWTTQDKTPYLVGEKEIDWNGPYRADQHAVEDIMLRFSDVGEITVLPWHLEKEDEPLQFFPSRTYGFELLVTLPLDEISERAFCGGKETSSERSKLLNAMKYRIGLEHPESTRDFAVNLVEYDFAQLAGRLFGEQGVASFTMPITIHVRSEEELPIALLKTELRPVVTLEEFYPGRVRANLLVPSVF